MDTAKMTVAEIEKANAVEGAKNQAARKFKKIPPWKLAMYKRDSDARVAREKVLSSMTDEERAKALVEEAGRFHEANDARRKATLRAFAAEEGVH